MDEIELMVAETYQHFGQYFPSEDAPADMDDVPAGPGVLYHIQRSSALFVIRTFVSSNIRYDYRHILENPEEYPSLRLADAEAVPEKRLRFFLVEDPAQAEIIHDQLNNRRFPANEELVCNISDPGFSWWLTGNGEWFQLSFNLSLSEDSGRIKLGPLGDQQLALKNFQALERLMTSAGLDFTIQNELNRVQFMDGEAFLVEELKDLFEFGVVSDGIRDLFRILAKTCKEASTLEMIWFYLQELAAVRRFWIQIQYDLDN
jgi:hypothetical protein